MAIFKKHYYTVMVVPEGNRKTFSIRFHSSIFKTLLFFLIVFTIGMSLLIIKSAEIAAKLQLVHALLNENNRIKEENKKLRTVWSKVENIENISKYLQKVAAVYGPETKVTKDVALAGAPGKIFTTDSIDNFVEKSRSQPVPAAQITDVAGPVMSEEFYAAVPTRAPVDGWITKKFSIAWNDSTASHPGIDYACAEGTLIRAPADGILSDIRFDKYFGVLVIVDHGYGFVTRYGHCRQALLAKGSHVRRGQSIAYSGNTGHSSAPHVHYEVVRNNRHVDPMDYMMELGN